MLFSGTGDRSNMTDERHFQLSPEYTDDDGHFYAVDNDGQFYLLDADTLETEGVTQRELSNGMYIVSVASADLESILISDSIPPTEVPVDVTEF